MRRGRAWRLSTGARRALGGPCGAGALLQVVASATRTLDRRRLPVGRSERQGLLGIEFGVLATPSAKPPGHRDGAK